jgi:hypothetical protein
LWAEEFVDEFSRFPNAEHDDMVDAASQALNYMIFSSGRVDLPPTGEQRRLEDAVAAEQNILLSGAIYDVYGGNEVY